MQPDTGNPTPTARGERLIILIDAPSLPVQPTRQANAEVLSLATFHEAIGELATRLQAGALHESDHPLIVAPLERLADDAQEVTAALRRLHPGTRVIGVRKPGVAHDERLLSALGIDLVPAGAVAEALDPATGSRAWPEARQGVDAAEPDDDEDAEEDETDDDAQESAEAEPDDADEDGSPTPRRMLERDWPDGGSLGFASAAASDDPPAAPLIEEDAPTRVTGMADEKLAALLISDPQQTPAACVELLRRRLGLEQLYLLGPDEPPIPEAAGVRIHLKDDGGGSLGTLVVEPEGERLAYAWSAWLTSWLRLTAHVQQLRRDAEIDQLTGAWNRRYLMRYLEESIERATEKRQALTVMVFDVDDLKAYNDTYGHAAGDEALREAVRLLRSVIRPNDRVCRIGGDEFVVVFYDPAGPRSPDSEHPRSAEELAKRFQTQVARSRFPKLTEEAPGRLSVSGGLATFPWDGVDAASLIRRADERAMRAKREGKNAIIFGPEAAE